VLESGLVLDVHFSRIDWKELRPLGFVAVLHAVAKRHTENERYHQKLHHHHRCSADVSLSPMLCWMRLLTGCESVIWTQRTPKATDRRQTNRLLTLWWFNDNIRFCFDEQLIATDVRLQRGPHTA